MIALGVNAQGKRTILAAELAYWESEERWLMFFRRLSECGLSGVRLVITDLCCGIRRAALVAFGGAAWQVCTVHLLRTATELMRKTDECRLAPDVSLAMHKGSSGYDGFMETIRALGYDAAASLLQAYRADALAYRAFQRKHWKAIYTTNPLENVNSVLKRRLRSAGPFPSDVSVIRIVGALLMQLETAVFAGKSYLHGMDEVLPDEEEAGETAAGDDEEWGHTFDSYPVSGNKTWLQVFS